MNWERRLREYEKEPNKVLEVYSGFILSVEDTTFWFRGTNLAGVDHEMEIVTKHIPIEKQRYIDAGSYLTVRVLEDKYSKEIKVDIEFTFDKRTPQEKRKSFENSLERANELMAKFRTKEQGR